MNIIKTERKQHAQRKYRRTQANKALVRYELQIAADAKARFEALVKAVADEFESPWDERQRVAKARRKVFDEITQGVLHKFTALEMQIRDLKAEIQALSPSFFIDTSHATALPEAIQALPDEPQQLKTILAKTFQDAQLAKQQAQKYKSSSEQYLKLYEASSNYNDDLKKQLKEAGILSE